MYRMLRWLGIGVAIVLMYMVAIHIQAYRGERKAEKYVAFVLKEISSPWNVRKMSYYGSKWFNKRDFIDNFVPLAQEGLGSFREITQKPKCNYVGYVKKYSGKTLIFAECITTVQFEKERVELSLRFIEEPSIPPQFFRVLGDNLKLNDFMKVKLIKGESN